MCVNTAGSIPRAAFYIPVAQLVERWSPKPEAAGSVPAGDARLCMTGGRHAESSGAFGRESSGCSSAPPFTLSEKTECTERCLYAVIAQLEERRPFKAGQRW